MKKSIKDFFSSQPSIMAGREGPAVAAVIPFTSQLSQLRDEEVLKDFFFSSAFMAGREGPRSGGLGLHYERTRSRMRSSPSHQPSIMDGLYLLQGEQLAALKP